VIQRDWFPVLEYEAPKAFHIGITSDLLSQFDERGTQWPLAAPEKTAALRGLSDVDLHGIFGRFTSVNSKLRYYLTWRLNISEKNPQPEPGELRALACVFRASGPAPTVPALPGSARLEERSVAGVLDQLKQGDLSQRRQALREFEGFLRLRPPAAAWLVAPCAAEAARAGMMDGDWRPAWAILNLGLQSEPDDPQLQYLARIFARAQPGAPALTMTP